ncbi:MAG: DUF1761 domain-containing protein [Emcibacter sp.]|nr:DUF1761 domain-containing protein [Emcibacter sp.]
MDIAQINLSAVLLAALAKFMVGALWYMPFLFGRAWLQDVGKKGEDLGSPLRPMMLSAALGLLTAYTLAVIIMVAGLDFIQSLAMAGLISIGIMASMIGPQMAYENRSFRLYAIYVGQYIVEFFVMAAIIGAWG